MIRQFLSLTASALLLILLVSQYLISSDFVLVRALRLTDAATATNWSTAFLSVLLLLQAEIKPLLWLVVAGAIAGLAATWWLRRWAATHDGLLTTTVKLGQGKLKNRLVDRFGVSYEMYDQPLDHLPVFGTLPAPVHELAGRLTEQELSEVSQFESELLAAMLASNAPSDVSTIHSEGLFEHSLSIWRKACADAGAGSLLAVAALMHDAGKILAFKKSDSGNWYKAKQTHTALTNEVIRRLPGFVDIDPATKSVLHSIAEQFNQPQSQAFGADIFETYSQIRAYDMAQTAGEKLTKQDMLRAGEVDFANLIAACAKAVARDDIGEKLNVNRHASASTPPTALYDPKEGTLFVQLYALRRILAEYLNEHNAVTLSIKSPSADNHESDAFILSALHTRGVLVKAYLQESSESGKWRVTLGRRQWGVCVCLDALRLPADKSRWGTPPEDFHVKGAGP